jgi:hypothetical protein
MRIVIVPATLALLPEYASIDDPIADLRKAVQEAVAWLVEDGPAQPMRDVEGHERIGRFLLGDHIGDGPGLLVVANGSAMRTEKAPGHFDDRAAAFDTAIGTALAEGDPTALKDIDEKLAKELWAWPDAEVLAHLWTQVGAVESAQVDYDDDPYGVQYWVVRWECAS